MGWPVADADQTRACERLRLSSNRYQNYEFPDPERFVPDGYALVRVDVRGTGRSPGFMNLLSERETRDLYECIEWAGQQPWSSGRVGLSGVSYLAMNQWQVAALRPPHLAALCVWEGCSDYYREFSRHGGICSLFGDLWIDKYVLPVQHGVGERGWRSNINGDWVSGPTTLDERKLAANRTDWKSDTRNARFASHSFWRSRLPDFKRIEVPLSPLPIGADRAFICAATLRGSSRPAPRKNGSTSIAWSTGRNSTQQPALICRSASLAISSKTRTLDGMQSLA